MSTSQSDGTPPERPNAAADRPAAQHLTHTLEMDAHSGVTSQTSPTSLPQQGRGAPRACDVACIASIQTLINQTQIENTKPTRKESKKIPELD